MLKTEEMRAFPEQNHSFLHMTKPQSILQQNQTSNATNFLSPLLFDNSIKFINPKKKKPPLKLFKTGLQSPQGIAQSAGDHAS